MTLDNLSIIITEKYDVVKSDEGNLHLASIEKPESSKEDEEIIHRLVISLNLNSTTL